MGTDGATVPVGPPPGAQAQRTLQAVAPIDPDTHGLALRSVDKLQISEALARSIVRGDPRALYPVDQEHAAIFAQDKELRDWVSNPNNAAIAQDDIPRLAALGRALDSHKPVGFFGGMADATETGALGLLNDMVAISAAKGATSPESAEQLILAGLKKQEEIAARAPEGLREFDKATGFFGKVVALPRALPYLAARVAPYFGAVMAAGAAGGAVGGSAAAPFAGAAEAVAPFTGPLAPVPAAAGAAIEAAGTAVGGFAGTFSAFGLMGAGGTALQELLARPDIRKPGAIAAALRDPAFLAKLNHDANLSGITNAAVTSTLMHLLPAGKMLGAAKGLPAKAAALGKETAIQTGVQLAGPLAAELATTGTIDTTNLPGQIVESGAMGLGFVLHGALATREGRVDFAKATQAVQDERAFAATTDELAQAKIADRYRPATEDLLRAKNRAVGLDVIGIPQEAWDAAQIDAGRSPRDEAIKLTGGDPAPYDEATRSGEIKVPAERLQYALAKDMPLRDALLPDLRMRPNGDTLTEGVARIQTMLEAQQRAEVTPEEQQAEQVRQAAHDEQRATELTAALGVPEDAGVLHQGPAPKGEPAPATPPTDHEAAIKAANSLVNDAVLGLQKERTPETEAALHTALDKLTEAQAAEKGAREARIAAKASPLSGAADAIEGAAQRPAAAVEGVAQGAQPIAEAARAALAGLPTEQVEPIAQAAQRDPVGTAANLRELDAVRQRQATRAQPEEVARRKAIETALRGAGRPKAEATPVARVLSDFIGEFKRRFPAMADKLDALMVRFAKEGAPGEDALKQGERGAYDPTERLITFFKGTDTSKGADVSTAIHEPMHWIADVITRLAADPEAPPELKAFRDEMFTAAGADPAQDALTVPQHETLATGLEAFVFGGAKAAPSVGLRKTFAVLQSLLLTVYKSVRQIIGADALSPALKDFYSRLLASEAEVQAAQRELGPAPILTPEEAAKAGVPDADAAEMQAAAVGAQDSAVSDMTRKVLADLDKQERALRKATIAELQRQERAKLNETAAWQAVANMRDGTKPDGSPLPEGVAQVKLDPALVEAAGFKVERLTKMGVTAAGGLAPADAAEMFGFDNATDFLEAVMGNANFDAVSRKAAMQRMAVEHPELVHDPIRRRIEARRSLDAGDARAKLVEAEIKALKAAAKLTREVQAAKDALSAEKIGNQQEAMGRRAAFEGIPTRAEARDFAQRSLARRHLNEIRPSAYRDGIARERRLSADAAKLGKFDEAAKHSGYELTLIELHREAVAIHKQAAKDVAYNLKIQAPSAQKVLNRVSDGSAEQANAILDRFQFRPRSAPQIERAKSLGEWLNDKANQGATLAVPADLVDEARRQHFSTLRPGELHAIRELLEGIYTLARDKDKFLKEQRVATVTAAGDEAAASVRANGKPRARGPHGALTPTEKAKLDVADLLAGGQVASMTARIMDGEADDGPMQVYAIRRINEATDVHAVTWREALEADANNYRDHFTPEEIADIDKREDFAGAKLTHNDRLSVLGHMGSVEGLKRLAVKFTPEQLDAIRKSFTPADYEFAADQWARFKAKFDEAAAQHKRITGQTVEPLELSPVQYVDAEGKTVELPGGYHPAAYTDLARFRYRSADWARQTKGGVPASQMLEMGFLEPRIKEPVTGDLRLDHGAVRSHLHAITHTIAFREAVLDVEAFLGHQGLRDAITETHGLQTLVMLDNWLKRVAGGARGARSGLEKGAAYLRHGAVAARLAFRVVSALHNLYGLRFIAVRNGPEAFGSALKAWFADSESVYKVPEWIRSKSPAMAERQHGTWLRELEESRQSLPGKFRTFVTHYGFLMMSKTQQFNDVMAWLSGYHKAMAERPAGVDMETWDKEAVARADQSMRDTQASGQAVDLSEWTGGGPLARLLTTFGTDMSLKFNHTRLAASRLRGPADIARFATDVAMLYMFEAVAVATAGVALGSDDKHPARTAVGRTLSELADTAPFARELSGPLRGADYRGPAGLMTIGSAIDAGIQIHQGELDPALWRSLNLLGGSMLDYPAAAINEFGESIGQVYGGQIPTAILGVRPKK